MCVVCAYIYGVCDFVCVWSQYIIYVVCKCCLCIYGIHIYKYGVYNMHICVLYVYMVCVTFVYMVCR